MFDPDYPIAWDKTVEIFEATASLAVVTRHMTLRQAVDCFLAVPEDDRWSIGVGVHEPILTLMNGKPVAVGFLNADGLRWLAEHPGYSNA